MSMRRLTPLRSAFGALAARVRLPAIRSLMALSLRKSLIFYIVVFAVIAIILSVVTFSICGSIANKIKSSYPLTGEKYYLTNEQGEQLGNGAFIGDTTIPMSKQDERAIALLELIPIIFNSIVAFVVPFGFFGLSKYVCL